MALENYFDFAENDYKYFIEAYENGTIANMMGAIAQGICEKYMKHLICEYYHPENISENEERNITLRTHSLNRLMKYLKNHYGNRIFKRSQSRDENYRWILFFSKISR